MLTVKQETREYGGFQGATYALSGPTEAGKTTFISKLVTQKARRLISFMIGQGSSTITNKTFVLSQETSYKNLIRLAAKPKEHALSRQDFDEKVTEIISKLAKQATKKSVKNKLSVKHLLEQGFLRGENHIAFLTLIGEKGLEWMEALAKTLETIDEDILIQIYDIAKSQLDSNKTVGAKKNESLDTKIAGVIISYLEGQFIQMDGRAVGEALTNHYLEVNNYFLDEAYEFFGTTEKTRDGFLVLDLDISNEEDEIVQSKITKFFSNNANDEKMSIEVLYSEIIVYVGVNEGLIKQLGEDIEHFKNRNGMFEVGLLDTMGAFHKKFNAKEETKEYFNKLSKSHRFDGMILLVPFSLSANDKKFFTLTQEFLCEFPFDLDVILISNKLDLVINQFRAEWKNKLDDYDAFSDDFIEDEPSEEELHEYLKSRVKVFSEDLIQYAEENGNGRAKIITHYITSFIENKIEIDGVEQLKNFSTIAVDMFKQFANLKGAVEKTSLKLDADYGSDVGLIINKGILQKELLDVLEDSMFSNVTQNARMYRGIIPHGNGFNALVDRLKYGEGYQSNIDSSWYVNVKSFNITFPGTIKNSINANLNDIWLSMYKALDFEGIVDIDSKLKEELFIKLLEKIDIRQIVRQAVYNLTYLPILSLALFSYGAKFQYYMENAIKLLGDSNNVLVYTEAIEIELQRAFKEMLDKDITYTF